jgi:hypothetical protein
MIILLWLLLLVFCWPLALAALVLYPILWLLLLPFRIAGIAVEGVLELLRALFLLPARLVRGPRHMEQWGSQPAASASRRGPSNP